MSKIAEKKALEAYPVLFSERNGYDSTFKDRRESYIKGYDQAMQDIEEFFYDRFNIHPHDYHVIQYVSDTPLESEDDFVEQIRKYADEHLVRNPAGDRHCVKNQF